jgi:hypothetical protein
MPCRKAGRAAQKNFVRPEMKKRLDAAQHGVVSAVQVA